MGWKLDPIAAALLATSLSVYGAGVTRLWRTAGYGRGVAPWQAGAFAVGWVVLLLATLSPLATSSERLLSVHMSQHELLVVVIAPLLMIGQPMTAVLWAPPRGWRRLRRALLALNAAVRRGRAPLVACTAYAAALWIWHVPALYEAAVAHDAVHALEHASFLVTACLFWNGLVHGRFGRLGYGMALAFVFATALHSGALGALFTLAARPAYALYAERSAALAVDPLVDQQIAGLLMWVPACAVLTVLGLAFFAAWLGELERRNRAHRFSRFTLERPE